MLQKAPPPVVPPTYTVSYLQQTAAASSGDVWGVGQVSTNQGLWCVQWQAACTDAAPAAVTGWDSYAGTTTTLPTKVVEPSTLPADDTLWTIRDEGWTTWTFSGK